MSLRHNQLGVQITSASAKQKIAVGTGSPNISKSFGGGTTKAPAICPKTCEECEEQLSMRVQIFNNVDEINSNTNFTY
jgi:hypothetical protein